MTELLNHYYDKLYYKTRDWTENTVISLKNYDQAADELRAFLTRQMLR